MSLIIKGMKMPEKEEQKEYSKVLDEIYHIKIGNINDIENQEVSE